MRWPSRRSCHAPAAELRRQIGRAARASGARIGDEVEEDVAVPSAACTAMQRIVVLAEVRHFVHVRRADQPAVEIVGPRVIRALDAAGERARSSPCRAACRDGGRRCRTRGLARRVARDDDAVAVHVADEDTGPARATSSVRPAQNHIVAEQPVELALEVAPDRCSTRAGSVRAPSGITSRGLTTIDRSRVPCSHEMS